MLLQLQLQVKNQKVVQISIFFSALEAIYYVRRLCKEDPVLVILDIYESNLSIPAIRVAKEN